MRFARVLGTGGYLPERVISNADLEELVDTKDEWIFERTCRQIDRSRARSPRKDA